MKYTVKHKTTYQYSSPVQQSYHLLHMSPCPVAYQTILKHTLTTLPVPASRVEGVDYFGNPYSILSLTEDHEAFEVEAVTVVELTGEPSCDLLATSPWEAVAQGEWKPGAASHKDIWLFAAASRYGRPLQAAADYAKPSFSKGRPVLDAVRDLTRRIYEDFEFDGTATDISTPVGEVLKMRRGVCQDFAHLQISCLRSLNLPARYVSGYILTHPPEGQERLQGADASHAWISVWAPEVGWVDFDPTNDQIPTHEHVTLAYGRDYDDVSPISGVLLGGGAHSVAVSVDMAPMS